jgi:endonuclease/exonuclease/phosphatase family metal-dependent hydrolase
MASIRLVSLNAYMLNCEARTRAFLENTDADVFCLQEIPATRLEEVQSWCKASAHVYGPVTWQARPPKYPEIEIGVSIFSRLPMRETNIGYYDKFDGTPRSTAGDPTTFNNRNGVLVSGLVGKEGVEYKIATMHFTWTPDGQPSDLQRVHIEELFTLLDPMGELVLTGDFNAPRGGEIWSRLAARYVDNVPLQYTTSLDAGLHRVKNLERMVDGVFSTQEYRVSAVSMKDGVSDHMALIATIEKNTPAA